ncbi:MAG TPA: penicillin acylase family protein [Lacunisphaera sp.]|jgi:penicillin amidase|nr:penicillin acylase family protein [Lacunisphaera sp.]
MLRITPRLLLSVLAVVLVITAAAVGWGWWLMRGSLPQLDGVRQVAGLGAAVTIERDALGVPTITGATRLDVARATGFVHAQDRFFQMDLLRRRAAGELSELFGAAALDMDKSARRHGFRRLAGEVLAQATPEERALLQAYTEGVNSGLAALGKIPWEYLILRAPAARWQPEDCVLCIYAMWFQLQDADANYERSRAALRETVGLSALEFLSPHGTSWDAALDGSTFPAAALPALRFEAPASGGSAAIAPLSSRLVYGSNAFAVAGTHTATGAALLANDMHLGLNVPNTWYRAVLRWSDASGPRRLVGVTLPGGPFLVVGSNGRIAWGVTDAYADSVDAVLVETEGIAQHYYRTPTGWKEIEERPETIKVKGEKPVLFRSRWTEWGPIVAGPTDGYYTAIRWTADDPAATNLHYFAMENAATAAAAVAIVHRSAFANLNTIIADADGHIAWTVLGKLPRRVGYDGRLPVSWAYGDRHWDGWVPEAEIPAITDPPEGVLWSANNRQVGGDGYAKLGDGGYDQGPRARQIRDDLRDLVASGGKAAPKDLFAIELDDRARFLERWHQFFLAVLDDEAVAQKPARGELRAVLKQWSGRADVASAAYRLTRAFRRHVAERALAPFFARAREQYPAFTAGSFQYEDAVWRLVHEQPVRLLDPASKSWPSLLLAAADDVIGEIDQTGLSAAHFTWGQRNTLAMHHPFARFLPEPLARLVDMAADPLPGDNDMPRVQSTSFGQSERLVVSPGHEDQGIFNMPGGQSGHPMSPYYRAGHEAWARGQATPLLPGPTRHTLTLQP